MSRRLSFLDSIYALFPALALSAFCAAAAAAGGGGETFRPADAADRIAAAAARSVPYLRSSGTGTSLRVAVIGDSMADGLYSGLYRLMKDDKRLALVKKTKVNTGIVRRDRYDWNEAARDIATSKEFDVAVVVLGTNDLQSIREGGKAYHFRQPGWEQRFRQRIDDIIVSLKDEDIALYWVGLPITRKDRYQADYAYVNDFFRTEAERHGIKFVETWGSFADENGDFTLYGSDANGKNIRLRADDGVHFTPEGYQMYASVVAEVMKLDLASAACAADAAVCGN